MIEDGGTLIDLNSYRKKKRGNADHDVDYQFKVNQMRAEKARLLEELFRYAEEKNELEDLIQSKSLRQKSPEEKSYEKRKKIDLYNRGVILFGALEEMKESDVDFAAMKRGCEVELDRLRDPLYFPQF
jgi:hypothetical protein